MISLVQKITSFGAPELQPYATLRRPLEHRQQGIFVAESERVVRRLLKSRFTIVSLVMPEKHLEDFRAAIDARPEPITVYLAPRQLLESLTGYSLFQGIFAVAKIPQLATLEDILQGPSPASPGTPAKLLVAVDEMSNAENVGALVRTCAAFGVHGLIVGETSSSPYLRRAVRNSMGTIFDLPIFEIETVRNADPSLRRDDPARQLTLVQVLRDLRRRGIHCIAAHPHTDKKTLFQADFTRDCCVVFGNEGDGISKEVLDTCDEAVAIPMPPNVDSLNVGAAAAVFLYEAARQRGNA